MPDAMFLRGYRMTDMLLCMSLIKASSDPDPLNSARRLFDEFNGVPSHVSYSPQTGTHPHEFYVYWDDCCLVTLAGALNFPAHHERVVSGYFYASDPDDVTGTHRFAWRIAGEVLDRVREFAPRQVRQLFVAGHSYGGHIAQAVLLRAPSYRPTVQFAGATFGAPKTLTARGLTAMNYVDLAMYQNSRDPVPWLLPNRAEGGLFTSTVLPGSLFGGSATVIPGRPEEFVPWPGWKILPDVGTAVIDSPVRERPPQTPTVNLLEWAFGIQGMLNPAHTAAAYLASIQRRAGSLPENLWQYFGLTDSGGTVSGGDWGGGDTANPLPVFVPTPAPAPTQAPSGTVLPSLASYVVRPSVGRITIRVGGVACGEARSRSHRRRCENAAWRLAQLLRGASKVEYGSLIDGLRRQVETGTRNP